MSNNPKTHREINITPPEFKSRLDDYLATRSSVTFLSDLPGMLLSSAQQSQSSHSPTSKYNVSVVNAVVMHVGIRAIDSIHGKGQRISTETIAHTAFMDIFQNLAVSLCTEGKPISVFSNPFWMLLTNHKVCLHNLQPQFQVDIFCSTQSQISSAIPILILTTSVARFFICFWRRTQSIFENKLLGKGFRFL